MVDLYNISEGQNDLITTGEIAQVDVKIIASDGNLITKSKTSEAEYLNLCLVIKNGQYSNRKIYHKIGIKGKKEDAEGNVWGRMGRVELKKIIRSAYRISSNDDSEEAKKKLNIESYEQINGLVCEVEIGVEPEQLGYPAKNKVVKFITPEKSDQKLEAELKDDCIPF
jgi:hypothetical protein